MVFTWIEKEIKSSVLYHPEFLMVKVVLWLVGENSCTQVRDFDRFDKACVYSQLQLTLFLRGSGRGDVILLYGFICTWYSFSLTRVTRGKGQVWLCILYCYLLHGHVLMPMQPALHLFRGWRIPCTLSGCLFVSRNLWAEHGLVMNLHTGTFVCGKREKDRMIFYQLFWSFEAKQLSCTCCPFPWHSRTEFSSPLMSSRTNILFSTYSLSSRTSIHSS